MVIKIANEFNLTDLITTVTYIVTGASLILKGLEILAKHTETKEDDKIIKKITVFLSNVLRFLKHFAINGDPEKYINKKR